MFTADITVNSSRLQADLEELAGIGRAEDRSIYRMAFTEADMQARRWLQDKLRTAGLEAEMDGAGNVFGKFPDRPDEPSVMIGSHLDTVPAAGPLDGALGVVAGLECLRRIKEENLHPDRAPVELVAFSDEEGRFDGGFFGSRAVRGSLIPQLIHEAADFDGTTLVEAMTSAGLEPLAALAARRPPGSIRSYLELHVEQGAVLDSLGLPVGIVENITGLFRWQIRLIGKADHAGTTPMGMRCDAFQGLAEFAGEIPRILEENDGEESVATIGFIRLLPGTVNTVPGEVEFSLDIRDIDRQVLDQLADTFRRALSAIARRRGLMFEFQELSSVEPVACDRKIVEAVSSSVESLGIEAHRMNSGAGHDAQVMAEIVPAGMVFVPSVGGRSHSIAEWTHVEDIVAGANVTLRTLLQLASTER